MPYIKQEDRIKYQRDIDNLHNKLKQNKYTAGDLNYCISKLIWTLFDDNPRYVNANELIGVLESVKLEFYRRKVANYEDEKIKENQDI